MPVAVHPKLHKFAQTTRPVSAAYDTAMASNPTIAALVRSEY